MNPCVYMPFIYLLWDISLVLALLALYRRLVPANYVSQLPSPISFQVDSEGGPGRMWEAETKGYPRCFFVPLFAFGGFIGSGLMSYLVPSPNVVCISFRVVPHHSPPVDSTLSPYFCSFPGAVVLSCCCQCLLWSYKTFVISSFV